MRIVAIPDVNEGGLLQTKVCRIDLEVRTSGTIVAGSALAAAIAPATAIVSANWCTRAGRSSRR
jgi:hypothetical protein